MPINEVDNEEFVPKGFIAFIIACFEVTQIVLQQNRRPEYFCTTPEQKHWGNSRWRTRCFKSCLTFVITASFNAILCFASLFWPSWNNQATEQRQIEVMWNKFFPQGNIVFKFCMEAKLLFPPENGHMKKFCPHLKWNLKEPQAQKRSSSKFVQKRITAFYMACLIAAFSPASLTWPIENSQPNFLSSLQKIDLYWNWWT